MEFLGDERQNSADGLGHQNRTDHCQGNRPGNHLLARILDGQTDEIEEAENQAADNRHPDLLPEYPEEILQTDLMQGKPADHQGAGLGAGVSTGIR